MKLSREHADDGVARLAESDRATEHLRAGRIAENRDVIVPRPVLVGAEQPSCAWLDAKRREEVGRRKAYENMPWLAVAGLGELPAGERRHIGENCRLALPFEIACAA